jgi:hypothetical protein
MLQKQSMKISDPFWAHADEMFPVSIDGWY